MRRHRVRHECAKIDTTSDKLLHLATCISTRKTAVAGSFHATKLCRSAVSLTSADRVCYSVSKCQRHHRGVRIRYRTWMPDVRNFLSTNGKSLTAVMRYFSVSWPEKATGQLLSDSIFPSQIDCRYSETLRVGVALHLEHSRRQWPMACM